MNQTPRPDLPTLLYPNITLKGNTTVFYAYLFFTDLHPELRRRTLSVCVCTHTHTHTHIYIYKYMYVSTSIYISEYMCV